MAASKYTGHANGFELVALPHKDEEYTAEVFGAPVVIPAGDGIAFFLRREKKYVAVSRPKGSPRTACELASRMTYPIDKALHGVLKPSSSMTVEQFEAFSGAMDERETRRKGWTNTVQPMIEDALAVLED